MRSTTQIAYALLFISSLSGFCTSYFPGVWGESPSFWLSDLIATLSYFTIISNLLIVALSASVLFAGQSRFAVWMSSGTVQTAIAVYIAITGIVYHLLLADTWNPTGIDKVSDELLHTVTPILYVGFWWFMVRGKPMAFSATLKMLSVPLLFLVYWLIRGPIVGSYPYFFMDINEYGVIQVTLNLLGLCVLFWLVGVVYWLLNRYTTPLYV